MNCKTTVTKLNMKGSPLWYRVKDSVGYHCARCYDHFRRFKDERALIQRRICTNCGSNHTVITAPINGRKFPHHRWYRDDKRGFWCNSCYHKITDDPIKVKERNQRRMLFKNKIIHVSENPRTGVCSLCGKEGRTSMHHIEYNDDDPLKHTIEICNSCHMKESMKIHNVRSLRWKTPI